MRDEIADKSAILEEKMLQMLEGLQKLFDFYSTQSPEVVDKGLVMKSGILVPLTTVDHRILFDHYEMTFISTFIRLAKVYSANLGSPLISFASRTLIEMSYRHAPVIFSKDSVVSPEEKARYKALHVLKDNLILGEQRKELLDEYNKLMKDPDVVGHLTEDDLKVFVSVEKTGNFKKLSRHVSNVLPKVPLARLSIIHKTLDDRLYSHFSELLHSGSLPAIGMSIDPGDDQRQKMFSMTLLIETTFALLILVVDLKTESLSAKEKKEFMALQSAYKSLYDETAAFWHKTYLRHAE